MLMLLGAIALVLALYQTARKVEAVIGLNTQQTLVESCQELISCQGAVRQYFRQCFHSQFDIMDPVKDYIIGPVRDYGVLSSRCITVKAREDGIISEEQEDPENLTHETFKKPFR